MNSLTLTFQQDLTRYFPGETLRGNLQWQLTRDEKQLLIQLLWHTSGESVRNAHVAEVITVDNPGLQGERAFEFTLPEGPHSFEGKLITLHWCVEATAPRNKATEVKSFTLSPTGEPLKRPVLETDQFPAGTPEFVRRMADRFGPPKPE